MRMTPGEDGLTKLKNYAALRVDLPRLRPPAGVLAADVKGMQAYNADHGHLAGDRLLELAGEALRACADGSAMAYRAGGDEFLLLAPGADEARLEQLAARVLCAVADRGEPALSLRLGWAVFDPALDVDMSETCRRARARLTAR